MKDFLISIIVPIYNAEKYIEKCINSITNQTYKNLEIILVDDGSTDKSGKICDKLSNKDKRIKVIHQTNSGVSIARNNALKIVTGDYIQFTDADDMMEIDMIEKMVKSAKENNSDIVICEYKNFYEKTNTFEIVKLKKYKNYTFKDLISNEKTQYGGFPWNKMIKTKMLKKHYNETIHYYENLLLFLENSKYIKKYSVVHEPLYIYNINENSAVHSKDYNLKKMSMLPALNLVIDNVDDKYKDYYKYLYINKTFENKIFIEESKIENTNINEYIVKANEYYKNIKKSKNLDLKIKIKLYIIKKVPVIYKKFKLKR